MTSMPTHIAAAYLIAPVLVVAIVVLAHGIMGVGL